MNIKKRGLNKGLSALLAGTGLMVEVSEDASSEPQEVNNMGNLILQHNNIPKNNNLETAMNSLQIGQLTPGKFQPRKLMQPQELAELTNSIKKHGILQPLIVRNIAPAEYEIIAGERRWQAAKMVGLTQVPVIIKNVNDQAALTIALIENIQRANLNPVEEAIALDRLIKEFALTHHEVALAVGKSRTGITNLLRILQLPANIKQMLENQTIDLGHAKVLLGAPYDLQLKIAHKIKEDSLSVRATEKLLKKLQPQLNHAANSQEISIDRLEQLSKLKNLKNSQDPDTYKLQQKLMEALGAKVIITADNAQKTKGKLIIHYNNLDELEGILEHFNLN